MRLGEWFDVALTSAPPASEASLVSRAARSRSSSASAT